MDSISREYYSNLHSISENARVTDNSGDKIDFFMGIRRSCELILKQGNSGNKLLFIGNGGSAAISSHMSTDFFKRGGLPAIAFNDSALLTCMGNDYGFDHVFEKPLEMYARAGDVLVAISSSGQSDNILLGVKAALAKGSLVITLSGFESDNPLSTMGEINFYVPSMSYGLVEVFHHSICHCILDTIISVKGELVV